MTNDQLTSGFIFLAVFVFGHTYHQWKENRAISKRFTGLRKALELMVEGLDKQTANNKALLEAATQKIISIMSGLPRPRKPPENG
jgi:hypothetical protein